MFWKMLSGASIRSEETKTIKRPGFTLDPGKFQYLRGCDDLVNLPLEDRITISQEF